MGVGGADSQRQMNRPAGGGGAIGPDPAEQSKKRADDATLAPDCRIPAALVACSRCLPIGPDLFPTLALQCLVGPCGAKWSRMASDP